jgi:CheY-like chemotaxis protein
MVHGLASQLNGGLSISSQPKEGSAINLWLPVSTIAVSVEEKLSQTCLDCNANATALLLNDEELVRMSTADMLTEIGYDVVEASSAEEALRVISEGLRPDLLVTDHLMPGMTGSELASKLKSSSPHMHVIVISGYAEAEGIDPKLMRLSKPFRNAERANSLSVFN